MDDPPIYLPILEFPKYTQDEHFKVKTILEHPIPTSKIYKNLKSMNQSE